MAINRSKRRVIDLCAMMLTAGSNDDDADLMTMLDFVAAAVIIAVCERVGDTPDAVAAKHANHIMEIVDATEE